MTPVPTNSSTTVDAQTSSIELGSQALADGEIRPWVNRQASEQALRAAQARQLSTRRRNIDPATSERNYDEDELEFMKAMQEYKASSGRLFPTWSEVLEVLRNLGYQKNSPLVQVDTKNPT